MSSGGEAEADDGAIQRLTDRVRADDAAAARRRQQSLRRQATGEGTLRGALVDLGERGVLVALATGAGRSIRGGVRSVGGDHVGLEAPNGQLVLVALAAVTLVRPEPGTGGTSGDRVVAGDRSLASVLDDLAADGTAVIVHTTSGDGVAGRLRGVGRDVLTLRSTGEGDTYVAIDRLTDVTLT